MHNNSNIVEIPHSKIPIINTEEDLVSKKFKATKLVYDLNMKNSNRLKLLKNLESKEGEISLEGLKDFYENENFGNSSSSVNG